MNDFCTCHKAGHPPCQNFARVTHCSQFYVEDACPCVYVLGSRKPKQDNVKSTSGSGDGRNPTTAENPDRHDETTSTGLPFSATVDPLLVHVPPYPPRPPTMHECQAIVRHLYATSSRQAREVSDQIISLHARPSAD